MSSPIQILGSISGDENIARRFMTHGDLVRESVKKRLRALGQEAKQMASARAPRSRGDRSPGSQKVGPLYRKIRPVVRSPDRGSVKMSIRPTPFYALFIEGGWTKAPFRRGNKKVDGSYGASRRVVMNRGYLGKNDDGDRVYRGFANVRGHVRRTGEDEYGAIETRRLKKRTEVGFGAKSVGVTFVKAHTAKPFSYRKTTHIAGRPFMEPVSRWVREQAQGRIDAAVREALNEPA